MDDNDITFTPDSLYISNLHSPQTYMAAVSPWFFTVCPSILVPPAS